jgi:probable HAF family extracellular repeat protein
MFAFLPRAECLEERSCPSSYSISALDPLPGDDTAVARAVNDAGQAVGYSNLREDPPNHAVIWQSGVSTPTPLGTLGGDDSTAWGIDSAGDVVGQSATSTGVEDSFLWQNGSMTDLGTLGGTGSLAYGVNRWSNVVVVGESQTSSGVVHAFLWQNGTMTDLGTLGGTNSVAYGINSTGQIVGESTTGDGSTHAFLWQNGAMTDLGVPKNGNYSSARAVNGSGQVAGAAIFNQRSLGHGALWQNGRWTDFGRLGPPYATFAAAGYGLTNSGIVVGDFRVDATFAAFVWQSKTGMTDLNTLIPGGSGWTIVYAYGINNGGQIVGLGRLAGTGSVGYLLTPTSAPTGLAATSSGTIQSAVSPSTISVATTKVGSDDSSSFPQGPLGVIPETATWGTWPLLIAHRRLTQKIAELGLTTLDPAWLTGTDRGLWTP